MIGAKIGAGREADVHAWRDDAIIKLYRPGLLGHRAEAKALATLAGHGIAPRLDDTVQWDGRVGLVLERLDGADLLTLLQQQPWRMLGMARTLAATHLAVHQVSAPADLPELRSVLAARITTATMPTRLRSFALRLLDALPEGERLCHGDYHPGNLMLTDGRATVIDWPNATRGVPAADHARTMLLLRYSAPLPETSRVTRRLITSSRSVFTRRYSRAYRAGSVQPLSQSGPWLAVQAAARLSEGVAVERATLFDLLERLVHQIKR
ncbi:phosphotransferase family protein [Salinispora tropica]|uniref:phosphotransferase family protein n=1 Tax=Salinispora tropica TaxID=168695 RepID=UPI0003802C5F|nr:aminoglycoside phosphotransferase family protein [Salinispora tropica]